MLEAAVLPMSSAGSGLDRYAASSAARYAASIPGSPLEVQGARKQGHPAEAAAAAAAAPQAMAAPPDHDPPGAAVKVEAHAAQAVAAAAQALAAAQLAAAKALAAAAAQAAAQLAATAARAAAAPVAAARAAAEAPAAATAAPLRHLSLRICPFCLLCVPGPLHCVPHGPVRNECRCYLRTRRSESGCPSGVSLAVSKWLLATASL